MNEKKIEFIDLKTQYLGLKETIALRMGRVFEHGQFIMGPEVREMEEALETYTGAPFCISVASGTEALLIALMAIGLKPGDEVITTPFTFAATAEVIALLGAVPVFVDIEDDTCNINASLIEKAITPKTKAIMPVSLYGQVADMDEINAIAKKHGGLTVIEDAAQSFGAEYKGKKSCNLSKIACTSFFPSKPLGCYGDGGAIFTQDKDLAQIMREIRVHGQEKRYYHTRIGVGGRMDTLQAAVILAKLTCFDWEIKERLKIGRRYQELLAGASNLRLPRVKADRDCVWAQFTVYARNREALCKKLQEALIPTAIHYPLSLHRQPAYEAISRVVGCLDKADTAANSVVSLPMHPYLTPEVQEKIVRVLLKD